MTRSGTKLCVDDSSSGTTDGNKIDLWTCNGSGAQQWTIGTDGTVRVLGKCLDASGNGTTNGTKTDLYTCNGAACQQWKAGANGSLVNTASGKCLDDPSSSTTNGTQLQIWTCNGTAGAALDERDGGHRSARRCAVLRLRRRGPHGLGDHPVRRQGPDHRLPLRRRAAACCCRPRQPARSSTSSEAPNNSPSTPAREQSRASGTTPARTASPKYAPPTAR
ncbi:ricin-type beta-trefoil lectin domain protein [Streptomyces lasalocidi]